MRNFPLLISGASQPILFVVHISTSQTVTSLHRSNRVFHCCRLYTQGLNLTAVSSRWPATAYWRGHCHRSVARDIRLDNSPKPNIISWPTAMSTAAWVYADCDLSPWVRDPSSSARLWLATGTPILSRPDADDWKRCTDYRLRSARILQSANDPWKSLYILYEFIAIFYYSILNIF